MDPFAKKMWRAGFAYGGMMLSLAAALTVVYVHNRPQCGDRMVSESTSPDRRWTATILERRCGEDAPFITQVNLRDAGTTLKRGFFSGQANENIVFSIEQDAAGSGLKFDWTHNGDLIIRCEHCEAKYVRRQQTQFGTLSIQYASF